MRLIRAVLLPPGGVFLLLAGYLIAASGHWLDQHFEPQQSVDAVALKLPSNPERYGSTTPDVDWSADDAQAMVQMVIGEARGEPAAGMQAIAHVAVNRYARG